MENIFIPNHTIDIAWCPGCGNFSIRESILEVLSELKIKQEKLVVVSGIGQAAKMPQYMKTHMFNGLHGRALPAATGIKAANPELVVIAEGGDGDMYGEGGNHFIHTIRRNPNITLIIHNNMVYGLTKGQASPTSQKGFVTPIQTNGVCLESLNPIAVAIALKASFVARSFTGDKNHTKRILKEGIKHKGFSIIDIFQPCVSFNKTNTLKWYQNHTYYLDKKYDPTNIHNAFEAATSDNKFPLGLIYKRHAEVFSETLLAYSTNKKALYLRRVDRKLIDKLFFNKEV